MPFDLSQYEPVEERLARFWAEHPNGRVHTELVNGSHAGESVVIIASVYKDKADLYPDATGHAQETPGSNPVNKTSWIENCETSAIGRALANMGYAPKGSRPSQEEMRKVATPRPSSNPPRSQTGRRTPTKKKWEPTAAQIALLNAAKDAGIDDELRHRLTAYATRNFSTGSVSSVKDLSDEQCDQITENFAYFQLHRDQVLAAVQEWEATL